MIPENMIVHLQCWPAIMDKKTAMVYLGGISESFFRTLQLQFPELRPMNLVPGGDPRWAKSDLDKYIDMRRDCGLEKTG